MLRIRAFTSPSSERNPMPFHGFEQARTAIIEYLNQ